MSFAGASRNLLDCRLLENTGLWWRLGSLFFSLRIGMERGKGLERRERRQGGRML